MLWASTASTPSTAPAVLGHYFAFAQGGGLWARIQLTRKLQPRVPLYAEIRDRSPGRGGVLGGRSIVSRSIVSFFSGFGLRGPGLE